jgi:hypothetical protein
MENIIDESPVQLTDRLTDQPDGRTDGPMARPTAGRSYTTRPPARPRANAEAIVRGTGDGRSFWVAKRAGG